MLNKQKARQMGKEWLYVVEADSDADRFTGCISLVIPVFSAWKLRRGDSIYLFRPEKNGAVLLGSVTVSEIRRSGAPDVVVCGAFEPRVRFKANLSGGGLRLFDYAAFMEKVRSRRSVREIVRYFDDAPAVHCGTCRVIEFRNRGESCR